jgi:hypothetical protein
MTAKKRAFVRLTLWNRNPIMVRPLAVSAVFYGSESQTTIVRVDGDDYHINESIAEAVRLLS